MWERLVEILDSNRVTRITLIGLEQTGKTTLSFFFAYVFREIAYQRGSYPVIVYYNWRSPKEALELTKRFNRWFNFQRKYNEECSDPPYDSIFYIYDDITFLGSTLSNDMRLFMNYMAKIWHKVKSKKIVITYITHYSKGILPFLRISHIRVVTSISSPSEVEGLKAYFRESSLWNFMQMKEQSIRKTKYLMLFNLWGQEFYSKPPRVPKAYNMRLEWFRKEKKEKEKTKEEYYTIKWGSVRNIKKVVRNNYIYVYIKEGNRYNLLIRLKKII